MEKRDGKKSPRRGNQEQPQNEGLEKVIQIDRINKVVKGGKRLSFRAFVIKGNFEGTAGFGLGKSKEVPMAIRKGIEKAQKNQITVNLDGDTIPHEVLGTYGASKVMMKPARKGTGVIAGGAVRILLEALGIKDVVAKSIGAGNAINNTKAAVNGLLQLRKLEDEVKRRGKALPVYQKEKKEA